MTLYDFYNTVIIRATEHPFLVIIVAPLLIFVAGVAMGLGCCLFVGATKSAHDICYTNADDGLTVQQRECIYHNRRREEGGKTD